MALAPRELHRLARDYLAGMSIGDIASKYGVAPSTVTKLRRDLELPPRRQRNHYRAANPETITKVKARLKMD